MDRAYSTIELKSINDEQRIVRGVASSIEMDRMGDIVEPKGAEFSLPIPFLWQHDASQPVGHVTKAIVSDSGIAVEIQIAKMDEPGRLKDRLDEAWQSLKSGLVRGLSIGFSPTEAKQIKGGFGTHFSRWKWLELSGVTIPANQLATITSIKSIDSALLARSGNTQSKSPPGVPGIKQPASSGFFYARNQGKSEMKTLQDLREERTTSANRLEELFEVKTSGAEFSDQDSTELDALKLQLKNLDEAIEVRELTQHKSATAVTVDGSSSEAGSASRNSARNSTSVFVPKQDPEDSFKGQGYIRQMKAQAAAWLATRQGYRLPASDFARKQWGRTNPQLVQLIKANEVAGGGTGSGEWGAELVGIDNRYRGDFINYLYSQTVYDRLGLRPAPKNVSVKGQDGAAIGYWIGESKAIPVSKPDFSTVDLTILKAAGITVASKELLADSDPAAEQLMRDSLVQAIAQLIDTRFLSATAASAGVSPAGILNGVSALHTSGTDEAAVRTMVKALYSQFITDKNASNLTFVMSPGMAKAIGMIVNALGQTSFPGLGATGGVLLGDRVITGDNVDPSTVLLVKPSDIWLLDDGLQVSMSDSAMIEQNSSPTGATDAPTAASVTMVSMFQEDSVAIKVVRRTSFKKRRANAVQYVDDADFDGTAS